MKDDIVGWFLRPSTRLFRILMADGIYDFDTTFVRVNCVEKILYLLRGTQKFHLKMEEISQSNGNHVHIR